MWGKIIIPMYRLWLNGLYGLYGPRCPLFSKRPINLISLSLSHLCIKAARQSNSLQRIAKYLNQNTKKIVFNSFILSNFNYCPLVWHICSIKNTQKVEKIHERGLHIILNDYQSDYKAVLESSGRELMYISRLKKLAMFVYKSYNNTSLGLTNDIFNKKDIPYNLRDNSNHHHHHHHHYFHHIIS